MTKSTKKATKTEGVGPKVYMVHLPSSPPTKAWCESMKGQFVLFNHPILPFLEILSNEELKENGISVPGEIYPALLFVVNGEIVDSLYGSHMFNTTLYFVNCSRKRNVEYAQ